MESKLARKNEVLSELMEEHVALKKSWGDLKAHWVPHDVRDAILDFIRTWSEKTEIPAAHFLAWIHLAASKVHDWKKR